MAFDPFFSSLFTVVLFWVILVCVVSALFPPLAEGIVPLGEGAAFSWCTAHQADCTTLAKVEGGDCTCLPARGTNMYY